MRHLYNFTRVLVLAVLIMGSVYQTGKLWLDVPSDHNFFYSVLPGLFQPTATVVGAKASLPEPEQLGIYIGNPGTEYTLIRRGATDYNSLVDAAMAILYETVRSGSYEGVQTADDALWEIRHYLISMPFELSRDMLTSAAGQSSGKLDLPERLDTIIVVPSEDKAESIRIYLTTGIAGDIYEYTVSKSSLTIQNEIMEKYLEEISEEEAYPSYISTRKNQIGNLYSDNVLLPVGDGEIYYHDALYWEVPYVQDGVIDVEALSDFVAGFFNNPDVASQMPFEKEVRYSDSEVIVKYGNDGLFEYVKGYTTTEEKVDIAKALGTAEEFLGRRLANDLVEYYIHDYEQDDKGVHFYYNTGYNGYPVVMSPGIRDQYGMDSAMEVTVAGDEVVGFKWVVRQLPDMLPQTKTLRMPYNEALDILLASVGSLDAPLEDMYLGYRWNEDGYGLTMNWILKDDSHTWFVEVVE